MKFFKYFLIWLCIVFLLGSVAGYVYIRLEGQRLFERQLTKFFGQPAQIEEIRYLVPVGIRLINVTIQNVLEVEDVRLHLRVPFLLSGHFIIAKLELDHPVFHLVRYEEKQVDFGGVYLKRQEEKFHSGIESSVSRVFQGIVIDLLSVQNGEMMLVDLVVPEPVKYDFVGIKGKAMKVMYPLSDQQIKLDVQGTIRSAGGQKFLKQAGFNAGGWINWPARAMDMTVNIHQQAGLSAKMMLKGKDNQLQVQGRLEADMSDEALLEVFKEMSQDGLGSVLFGALQTSQSKVGLNISMETKMDAFSFGLVNFQGEWEVSDQKKETLERLSPSSLFGIIPAVSGAPVKK